MKQVWVRFSILVGLLLGAWAPGVARAQQKLGQPPETVVETPGGIDAVSGVFRDPTKDLSVGSEGDGGLTFVRVKRRGQNANITSNWHYRLRWRTHVRPQAQGGGTDEVQLSIISQDIAKSFTSYNGGLIVETGPTSNGLLKLELIGSGGSAFYLYTGPDGTIVKFGSTLSECTHYIATELTKPNGTVYTLTNDSSGRRVRVSMVSLDVV